VTVTIKNLETKDIEERYWIAILQIDYSNSLVNPGEIGIFMDIIKEKKNLQEDMIISVKPADPPDSFKFIQKKIKGIKLTAEEINEIIADTVSGSLSKIDLAAFITAVVIDLCRSKKWRSL